MEAVLAAAARILEERGLAGFNTNAVAERAGVSIGSLYQYFPSKDAILLALMERSLTLFSEALSAAIDGAPGQRLGDDLMCMLQMGLSAHLNQPSLARLLEDEFARLEGHVDKASTHLAVREAVMRLLNRYGRHIRTENLQVASEDLGVIARGLMRAAGERCERDWERVIRRTVRSMLGYLDAPWNARPSPAWADAAAIQAMNQA